MAKRKPCEYCENEVIITRDGRNGHYILRRLRNE